LTFAWLSLGTAAIDRLQAVTPQPKSRRQPWGDLAKRLDALAARAETPDARPELREWLINVALLLMPESGLAWLPDLEDHFELVATAELRSFWQRHARLIRRTRAMRLAEFVRNEMAALVSWLRASPGLVRKSDSPLAKFRVHSAPTLALIHQFAGTAPAPAIRTRRPGGSRTSPPGHQAPSPPSPSATPAASKSPEKAPPSRQRQGPGTTPPRKKK
jgi:hypothetical protein